MTIAMLSLAGFPATAGFFGKLYLIEAAVDDGYAWLGVVIVLGSAISLAYYLRVIAAVWMRSPAEARRSPRSRCARRRARLIAGGSAEADADRTLAPPRRRSGRGSRSPRSSSSRSLCARDGVLRDLPAPLLDLAQDAGAALST